MLAANLKTKTKFGLKLKEVYGIMRSKYMVGSNESYTVSYLIYAKNSVL